MALIKIPRQAVAWRGPRLIAAIRAIQLSIDRLVDFLEGIVRNSRPTTADTLADQWESEYPLWSATGGQTVEYLQAQLQRRWPNVYITPLIFDEAGMCGVAECGVEECDGFPAISELGGAYPVSYYYLKGYVDTRTAFNRMVATVERVFPAQMTAINFVYVLNEDARSEAGLAEAGVEQAG